MTCYINSLNEVYEINIKLIFKDGSKYTFKKIANLRSSPSCVIEGLDFNYIILIDLNYRSLSCEIKVLNYTSDIDLEYIDVKAGIINRKEMD